ncbi:MAG: hypothetical protein KDK25_00800 [Leptospiraceae bacterium]|nr:hypothetical protein [Leptospiraceae bacterium]
MILNRNTLKGGAILLFLAIFMSPMLPGGALHGQSTSNMERFDYNGSMLVRGFYTSRDLPLEKQTATLCPNPFQKNSSSSGSTSSNSRCREERDFYTARFRLNFAFRPSNYVDVLYGLEVGHVEFGDTTTGDTGPGSGGTGSGSANLETRELRLKIHNEDDTLSFHAGIFPYGTPNGFVAATSGAGFYLDYAVPEWYSNFELYYIKKEDQSRVDRDSNGFNDDNYKDVDVVLGNWKYSGLPGYRSELYGLYRGDNRTEDASGNARDTSRLYWAGLFQRYRWGRFSFMLHLIGNWGNVYTTSREYPREDLLEGSSVLTLARNAENFIPEQREKHAIAAGAGEAEIGFQITDDIKFSAAVAGASGRRGVEPDGRSVNYRADQFHYASQAYQFSEISVDSSGGYSLFALGDLTGLVVRGLRLEAQVFESVDTLIGYYSLHSYRTPTLDYNQFFTQFPGGKSPSSYFGQEINWKVNWRPFSDLTLSAYVAYFDAGDGYKVLRDVEYGDRALEILVSAEQTF